MINKSKRSGLMVSTTLCGALLSAVALTAITSVVPTVAVAQDYTSGNLSGTVTDPSGKPVAGAAVKVVSPQGAVSTATTNEAGEFSIRALSVGEYQVQISKGGYTTTDATATIAPVGSSYTFAISAEGDTTTVTVRGKRRNDFAKNDIGSVVNVEELTERVPVGRSINAVTLLTPGASLPDATINASARRNQSLISLAGTSAAESSYYINGMQVTDQRNLLGYADLPFDFIETIETKTGGYSAEFGRGTGGVINMVTKSGSNKWTGGISLFTTPDFTRAERGESYAPGGTGSAGQIVRNQYSKSDSAEASFYLGGPIIKDRLFFFANYNPRWVHSYGAASFATPTTTSGTITESNYNDPRWGAKLDWVINSDHRLEYTIFSDKTETSYQPYVFNKTDGTIGAASPSYTEMAGGQNQILKYTGRFTNWFTLSALMGRVESAYKDYGSAIDSPGVYDYVKGGYINARRPALYDLRGEDIRDTFRVDGDFYFTLAGDHHIKVGYDQEKLTSDAYSAYNGGAIYYGYTADMWYSSPSDYPAGVTDSTPLIEKLTFANNGVFKAEQSAIYIQDFWRITPSLSVQIGVRNDIYDYKNINGKSYVKIEDQWAPRLAFNWDPRGLGMDRIYGSVGDYYLPIATNTSIRASSGEVYTDELFLGTRDASGNIVLNASGYPTLGNRLSIDYYSPPGAPDTRAVAEADLKPMYEREFIIGYEHTFSDGYFADWRMGLRYINRKLESTIEDTAIGDAVLRYCARNKLTICSDDPSIYPYVLFNPGDGASVFVDLQGDAAALPSGAANPAYNPQRIELTSADLNMPEATREYKALEFTFNRPFDGKWSMAGSYTLAKSYGNYEGAVKSDIGQTDTSITQDFDHSANTIGATGYLPNHHRHTLKIYGNYVVNDWFTVGANFFAQSGRKYGCLGTVPLTVDPYAPTSGTPSGWFCPGNELNTATAATNDYVRVATPRGSMGETDWVYQLDLNLGFKLREFEDGSAVTASVDVFNLFDGDTVTRVVEQGEIRTAASGVKGTKAAYYGQPRTYQSPRQIRFGLRYKF